MGTNGSLRRYGCDGGFKPAAMDLVARFGEKEIVHVVTVDLRIGQTVRSKSFASSNSPGERSVTEADIYWGLAKVFIFFWGGGVCLRNRRTWCPLQHTSCLYPDKY